MTGNCQCGSFCDLCEECGEPLCECYCFFKDEEPKKDENDEDSDYDSW